MPIYEYQCTNCFHKFDVLQKIHDDPVKKCPECSKNKVVRLVSAAGFQLKGSGWYATDFKNKGKPEAKTENNAVATADSKNTPETKAAEPSTTTSVAPKGESD